jgi:hypothetical protein
VVLYLQQTVDAEKENEQNKATNKHHNMYISRALAPCFTRRPLPHVAPLLQGSARVLAALLPFLAARPF